MVVEKRQKKLIHLVDKEVALTLLNNRRKGQHSHTVSTLSQILEAIDIILEGPQLILDTGHWSGGNRDVLPEKTVILMKTNVGVNCCLFSTGSTKTSCGGVTKQTR